MISLIVATDENFGIGKDNTIPWHSSEDLMYFREVTMGKDILMGKNTYESLLKRFKKPYFQPVLSGRKNIVLSTTIPKNLHTRYLLENYTKPSITLFSNIEKIVSTYHKESPKELFIIGGEEIYKNTIHLVDTIYINTIKGSYDCDAFFPKELLNNFHLLEQFTKDKNSDVTYSIYARNTNVSVTT